jgi:hypothetical protein
MIPNVTDVEIGATAYAACEALAQAGRPTIFEGSNAMRIFQEDSPRRNRRGHVTSTEFRFGTQWDGRAEG